MRILTVSGWVAFLAMSGVALTLYLGKAAAPPPVPPRSDAPAAPLAGLRAVAVRADVTGDPGVTADDLRKLAADAVAGAGVRVVDDPVAADGGVVVTVKASLPPIVPGLCIVEVAVSVSREVTAGPARCVAPVEATGSVLAGREGQTGPAVRQAAEAQLTRLAGRLKEAAKPAP